MKKSKIVKKRLLKAAKKLKLKVYGIESAIVEGEKVWGIDFSPGGRVKGGLGFTLYYSKDLDETLDYFIRDLDHEYKEKSNYLLATN